MRAFLLAVSACAVLVSGCAIKPTPDDTTRFYTNEIVDHVRCEAQREIQKQTVSLLQAYGEFPLAEKLERDGTQGFAREMKRYKSLKLSKALQDKLARYLGVGIAYEFTLDNTEENNDQFQMNLLGPFTGGNGSLGLKAGLDRQRENVRIFTVTDTFDELVQNTTVCKQPTQPINFIYPLGGTILVAETIDNFIDLYELSTLREKSKDDTGVYSDKFHFKTVVSGTFNPSGQLTPSDFGPKDLSLTDSNTRTDDHQLIIGISLPAKPSFAPVVFTPGLLGPVGAASVSSASNPAVARAVQAIQDAKVNYFLNNFNGFAPR